MSKDITSDVLENRVKAENARRARNFQLLMGRTPDSNDQNETTQDIDEDADFDPFTDEGGLFSSRDRVDSGLPEGLFSGTKPRSNDKLLEQLLGKKAANAHRKTQKQQGIDTNGAGHAAAKPLTKPAKRKVDDDDSGDEGGRAAAIKSKKPKTSKAPSQPEAVPVQVTEDAVLIVNDDPEDVTVTEAAPPTPVSPPPRRAAKAKPASFLDELLSKKSKKKKMKANADSTGND